MDQFASTYESLAGLLDELDPALWTGVDLWLEVWHEGDLL